MDQVLFSLARDKYCQLLFEKWSIPTQQTCNIWERLTTSNKGIGAGGKNTTLSGKFLEDKALMLPYLITNGFVQKEDLYVYEIEENKQTILFMAQTRFCKYVLEKFNVCCNRRPDAAYIIKKGDNYIIKILEVKNQTASGSVIDKMLGGGSMLEYYRYIFGNKCSVQYAYAVSDYISNEFKIRKTFQILKETTFKMYDIKIFTVSSPTYCQDLLIWIKE